MEPTLRGDSRDNQPRGRAGTGRALEALHYSAEGVGPLAQHSPPQGAQLLGTAKMATWVVGCPRSPHHPGARQAPGVVTLIALPPRPRSEDRALSPHTADGDAEAKRWSNLPTVTKAAWPLCPLCPPTSLREQGQGQGAAAVLLPTTLKAFPQSVLRPSPGSDC